MYFHLLGDVFSTIFSYVRFYFYFKYWNRSPSRWHNFLTTSHVAELSPSLEFFPRLILTLICCYYIPLSTSIWFSMFVVFPLVLCRSHHIWNAETIVHAYPAMVAQTALVHHLSSEIRISYLYTRYIDFPTKFVLQSQLDLGNSELCFATSGVTSSAEQLLEGTGGPHDNYLGPCLFWGS